MERPIKYVTFLLLALVACTAMYGQMDNPANWFYVGLQARVSSNACGGDAGDVQLMFTDVQRNIVNEKPQNPYAEERMNT